MRFTGALSRIACAATVPDAVVRNVCGLAFLIASIRIYGVLAYLTHQSVPEIGVRMALGASAREVMWMVLRNSFTMVLAGVVAGALAVAAIRLLPFGCCYGSSKARAEPIKRYSDWRP